MLFTYRDKCEFCNQSHSDNCDFEFPRDCTSLLDLTRKAESRDLALVVQWQSSPEARLDLLEQPDVKLVNDDGTNANSSDGITLHDCLNAFTMEEMLSGQDMWYCNKCKEHV